MVLPQAQRRLAAIMFTDMAGYTALGQRDELLSLALVEEQRKLLRPVFDRHNGREVKTMGDAFLVEFGNVLDSVRCAYDVQRASREFNISQPSDQRIVLRIGLHLGDVVESQGDISGDAVNVASRIESLAEGGGVCLTRQVYDHIHNKFELPMTSLGGKQLKNVSVPVEVFKMVMPWEGVMMEEVKALDRGRIAVLPLKNMSPDPNDEYFADGMTEELITVLSGVRELTIIARTSVMQYKDSPKRVADVGRELRTGTVIEGSVRKAADKVRITVQMVDAVTEGHLWAQSYDRDLQDVFAVQSDIATNVAQALKVKLLASEASQIQKKPTEDTEAYLLYLRGRQYWNTRTEESVRKAMECFRLALERDPNFALAYVGLADSYHVLVTESIIDFSEAHEKARENITRALALDERLAEAHASYGIVLGDDWRWADAEAEFKRAIEINPNYATAHQWNSLLLTQEGRAEEALVEARKALELDPQAPVMSWNVARILVDLERYDDAIEHFKRSLSLEPNFIRSLVGLEESYLEKGDFEEAMMWWEKTARIGNEAWSMLELAMLQAKAGDRDGALASLDSAMGLKEYGKLTPLALAEFFTELHEYDKALTWLEQGSISHDRSMIFVKASLSLRKLHSNPRFTAILKRMGLDKY